MYLVQMVKFKIQNFDILVIIKCKMTTNELNVDVNINKQYRQKRQNQLTNYNNQQTDEFIDDNSSSFQIEGEIGYRKDKDKNKGKIQINEVAADVQTNIDVGIDIDINTHANVDVDANDSSTKNNPSNKSKTCLVISLITIILLLLLIVSSEQSKSGSQQQQKLLQKQENIPASSEQTKYQQSIIQSHKPVEFGQKQYTKVVEKAYHNHSAASNDNTYYKQNYPQRCSEYLDYSISQSPTVTYYEWYGKLGKSISGKTYETGHLYERHLAVGQKCTPQQKRQKKTVFLNMIELTIALAEVSLVCDMHNHQQFQFKQDGTFNQFSYNVKGIDCSTEKQMVFTKYFALFKRATLDPSPSQQDYMKSMFVTLWTFYPKR